ncbi:hypothetical protein CR513_50584, partial [Mucuna pruriens]
MLAIYRCPLDIAPTLLSTHNPRQRQPQPCCSYAIAWFSYPLLQHLPGFASSLPPMTVHFSIVPSKQMATDATFSSSSIWLDIKISLSLIILVQEKNIRRLNELVRHLQEQLQQCRGRNGTINGTVSPLAERILELERQQILED